MHARKKLARSLCLLLNMSEHYIYSHVIINSSWPVTCSKRFITMGMHISIMR